MCTYKLSDSDRPSFEAREVVLGTRAGNQYVVESGLSEGEQVVTHGTFKIDSAAQLSDKLSMMNREPGTGANQTGHEGHTMPVESSGQEQSMNTIQQEMDVIPTEFQNQLKEVLADYLEIKNALFESKPDAASTAAQSLNTSLQNVEMSLLTGEVHIQWMDMLETIRNNNQAIANSDEIEQQRSAFIGLSMSLTESVRTFQVPGVVFEQFCPMANDGEGATWLSDSEQVQNPYYGDQMHNCGETVERIEF
ncbi:MAG: DUF3347 domain-containing protein [Balneolaceae bacterium]|nr:DUF3347 domain-containing protein [Balneolaceae bacterium]